MKDFWSKNRKFQVCKIRNFLLKTPGKETRGGELYAEKKIIEKSFREAEKVRNKKVPGFCERHPVFLLWLYLSLIFCILLRTYTYHLKCKVNL